MVTSMPLDGQIAWRHHGLMQIQISRDGRIAPVQLYKGVVLAVENSMPDLDLDPGLDPTTGALRSRFKCSLLVVQRRYGATS
jgi:hypothetical protein